MLEFPSFLRRNNIPCVGIQTATNTRPRILFIHFSTDGHLGCSHSLPIISKAPEYGLLLWIEVYEYIFKTVLSVLSEVKLLDHMVALFLIFRGTAILFSTEAAPFYIPTSRAQGFQCFHILANTCSVVWCFVLIIGILTCVRCKEEHFYARYFQYGK